MFISINLARSMMRKFLALSMSVALCWTAVGCSSSSLGDPQRPQDRPAATTRADQKLPNGQFGVQQATFDDGTGEYTVLLRDTPAGVNSAFRTENLKLAQLTPDEVKAGQKAYLKSENGEVSLHIPEEFKIEYVHNVTENVTDPQTGRTETVVVRQEPSFWSPFAGALAGQAIGSLLFRPQYYVPPFYQPGVPLTGFGGYGSSYGQAVNRYQERYRSAPVVERNRQVFRSTGRIGSPGLNNPRVRRPAINRDRPTGSGYGTSTLRRSNRSTPSRVNRPGGFGSGTRSRSSFGSGRRR
ncbi:MULTISPECIES: hypothetical protein [Leptolyngbya]|jgi:hypothetical protein|nr:MULTISPECIES: hypothetical protein [Leptolyngbya]ULP27851.1 hypothetical protein MCP04_17640 [Leptolyngbya boryana IU 594]BAS57108.1 hypothetical protein LBWT_30610 [Leptolyngbya boryana IAM M-101]BAS63456.1 hypothetical protein LBDG_30610 [Leptolyngbya boryana dg5]